MAKNDHFNYYKLSLRDRYDGWRLNNIDPIFGVVPYIMRTRLDSQVFFEQAIPMANIESFMKEHREQMPELGIMHVVMAALVRTISQYPRFNRFVVWNKLYARNSISLALSVKRSMSEDGEESVVKPFFQPTDTLPQVVDKIQKELDSTLKQGQQNKVDGAVKVLNYLPPILMRSFATLVRWLDNVGWLPHFLVDLSPWHSSIFFTNVGSLGIESIYHHLYEFGTCSVFVSLGKKRYDTSFDADGNLSTQKDVLLRVVVDERICDGFYYAMAMRYLAKQLANPELLMTPPETVVRDNGVKRKEQRQ